MLNTPGTQAFQRHRWITVITEVFEVAFYFEVRTDPLIFSQRVWIHSIFREFIVVPLYKPRIQRKPAHHLILQRPLMHQFEINIPAEQWVLIYVNSYLVQLILVLHHILVRLQIGRILVGPY